ncbi:hypothetical protein CPB85DRAFT_1296964 [Mucidula mucida]|nr:hypothetical protein CPB85DRAFT_1296964 [Mucidula mucida]
MATLRAHCATCTCHAELPRNPDVPPKPPTSVNDILLSNNPACFDDIRVLHAYRASVDASVTRLNEDIDSITSLQDNLQSLLDERNAILDLLKEQRAALQERQQQIMGALSIVRQLPLEVLQQIFLMTTLASDSSCPDGFLLFNRNDSPWAASRVCRRWRAASQWPRLWSSFQITSEGCDVKRDGYSHHLTGYKNPVAILQTALQRSGSCKLAFEFVVQREEYEEDERVQELLKVLMSHSERWERAVFEVPGYLSKQLIAVRGQISALKELIFDDNDPDGIWEAAVDGIPVVRAFEVAPLLEDVSICNAYVSLDYCPNLVGFSFHSGIHLPEPILDPLSILEAGTRLVKFHDRGALRRQWTNNLPRLTHHSLHDLKVTDCHLLTLLCLPVLTSLTAGDNDSHNILPYLPVLANFLIVSRCSLTSLVLWNCDLHFGRISDVLELVPMLFVDAVMSVLIKDLCQLSDDDEQSHTMIHRFVSRLECFTFSAVLESRQTWTFVDSSLVDMIYSRWEPFVEVESRSRRRCCGLA